MPVTNTYGAPGACTAAKEGDCYARHAVEVPLTSAWKNFEFPWSELAPSFTSAWAPAFDPKRLLAIYFELPANEEGQIPMYAFELDDVEFMD